MRIAQVPCMHPGGVGGELRLLRRQADSGLVQENAAFRVQLPVLR
jgi:hypothetical protein